jgi:hypothetical protein
VTAADVFADVKPKKAVVQRYAVSLQIRALIVGGVPSSPSVIRGWLRTRLEMGDTALEELVAQTFAERDIPGWENSDEAVDVLMQSDLAPSVNGFKRDPETGELVYESRCMKAALKEWANSSYPGTDWPRTHAAHNPKRKGLMNTIAEMAFVEGDFIGLGVKEPTEVQERIKRVMTPQGPRSAIGRVEVIERPRLDFVLKVHDDFLPREAWARVFSRGEDIGIGADRGRSDGQFDLLNFTAI